jgi:hypothetical protein
MATLTRQPFAPLDGARLQSLTSLKNRQNGMWPLSLFISPQTLGIGVYCVLKTLGSFFLLLCSLHKLFLLLRNFFCFSRALNECDSR